MSAAPKETTRQAVQRDTASRERRCIVTRESRPARDLIRFVVSPDGAIVPDPAERLPGRGLWTGATRDIVETACSGRMFDKAAKQPVSVASDLADTVERLLLRRCLDMIGLARRAGEAVAGFEKARAVVSAGKAVLAIAAYDGAPGGRQKLLSGHPDLPVIDIFFREELGRVFDREDVVFAAISNRGIGAKLQVEANRLAGFRNMVPVDGRQAEIGVRAVSG